MRSVFVNGNDCIDAVVRGTGTSIQVQHNGDNLEIQGDHNHVRILANAGNLKVAGDHLEVDVAANDSNLNVYGDFNEVLVRVNNCNLHIYGDHSSVTVINNESNLHNYGDYCSVTVQRGKAVIYGYYGTVTLQPGTEVEAYGKYKKISQQTEGGEQMIPVAVPIPIEALASLVQKALADPAIDLRLHVITPYEPLMEFGITEHITLGEFHERFLADPNMRDCVEIFRKDRSERGYMRYKILIRKPGGEWIYAFDLNHWSEKGI
jgi:hypothetical protein